MVKDMQVIEHKIEIDETLLAEIEEAAEFEQKSLVEYVDFALRIALKRTENKRLLPEKIRKFKESYEKFPDELETSEEEWAYWDKQYKKWEQNNK
jgi:Arc/MetJ family transcription regulator